MQQPHFPFEDRYPFFNKRALDLQDLEHMCDSEGITLQVRKLHCHGLYVRVHDVPTIFISEDLSEQQRVFALLHELGHHFLHPHLDKNYLKDIFFPYVEIEQQANDVALIGVAPHPALERMFQQHRLTPGQLRRRFPIFNELSELSTNRTLHPLHFLRRRIELFHEHRLNPELDFLGTIKLRAQGLPRRHRRPIERTQVKRGVTEVEAVLKWGDPAQILTRKRRGQSLAKWIYRKRDDEGLPRVQRLFFRDGVLVGARL